MNDPRLDRVAGHPYFRKAPVLRDLLIFLWKHRDREISGYELVTEVLGRPQDFDPKTGSSVRVPIGRLRQRLKEYAQQPDADNSLELECQGSFGQPPRRSIHAHRGEMIVRQPIWIRVAGTKHRTKNRLRCAGLRLRSRA